MTLRCVSFPNSISGAVSGANAQVSVCELVAMMVPALFFCCDDSGVWPCPVGAWPRVWSCPCRARPSPVRCDASFAVCCSYWYGDDFWNPRRWGSCLRGCYGGQGLHLGHPHGVRVESCNGASLCGSLPHEQWRRS